MLQPVFTTSFDKDVKLLKKRGYDMAKLTSIIDFLVLNERPLPPVYKDHPLKGDWEPKRELHIAPDWLLIYEISGNQCFFARTGTHSDIFKK